MAVSLRRRLLPGFLLGLLFVGAAPTLRANVLDDNGKFFSKEAIKKADQLIREIKKETTNDVVVETFEEPPTIKKEGLNGKDRDKALSDWAAERAKQLKLNGVYILICRKPGLIRISPGGNLRAFTQENGKRTFEILRKDVGGKDSDEGLLKALGYIQEAMRMNLKQR
jgi:hypothetical protein